MRYYKEKNNEKKRKGKNDHKSDTYPPFNKVSTTTSNPHA